MARYTHFPAVLVQDPNMKGFNADPGRFKAIEQSTKGQTIIELLTSISGVNLIVGAVSAAPSRPPVVAVEQLLLTEIAAVQFDHETKQFIGRLVRKIVEHLGGRWVRSGVKITVASVFSKGSIYSF